VAARHSLKQRSAGQGPATHSGADPSPPASRLACSATSRITCPLPGGASTTAQRSCASPSGATPYPRTTPCFLQPAGERVPLLRDWWIDGLTEYTCGGTCANVRGVVDGRLPQPEHKVAVGHPGCARYITAGWLPCLCTARVTRPGMEPKNEQQGRPQDRSKGKLHCRASTCRQAPPAQRPAGAICSRSSGGARAVGAGRQHLSTVQ
jgi:hypothetical protein